jgi:hypothetical protein
MNTPTESHETVPYFTNNNYSSEVYFVVLFASNVSTFAAAPPREVWPEQALFLGLPAAACWLALCFYSLCPRFEGLGGDER